MIQPNPACAAFCFWLLNISWQKLSTSQRNLVELIELNALTNTPVTNQQWNNFNLFTAWRYPYYLVYAENSAVVNPSLNSGLVLAYDFEGNSNSSFGANNGLDDVISYGLSYGRVLQGAMFSGSVSAITFSDVNPSSTYSISIFFYINGGTPLYHTIWMDNGVNYGLFVRQSTRQIEAIGTNVITGGSTIINGTWNHVVLTSSPAGSQIWLNGVQAINSALPIIIPTLNRMGNLFGVYNFNGNLDCAAIWNRVLTNDEILLLYNSGLGLQYPF